MAPPVPRLPPTGDTLLEQLGVGAVDAHQVGPLAGDELLDGAGGLFPGDWRHDRRTESEANHGRTSAAHGINYRNI